MPTDAEGLPEEYYMRTAMDEENDRLKARIKALELENENLRDLVSRLRKSGERKGYPWDDSSNS